MKSYGVTIQMKPLSAVLSHGTIYQYVALTFESVDEILSCCYPNKTSLALRLRDLLSGTYILFFETDCSAKSCGVTMRNLSVKEKEIVKHLFPSFD